VRHSGFAAAAAVVIGFLLSVVFPSGLVAANAAPSDDSIATADGALAIHAIHHAALTLTWNNVHILVDPAPNPAAPKGGDPVAEFKAMPPPDLILYTHDHGDHFDADVLTAIAGKATIIAPQEVATKIPAALKDQTEVLANGDKTTFKAISIEAVAMYNTTPERLSYHPKGGGNGYVLTIGAKRIYVAGDTEETPEMDALTGIDVAFVPMNLPYTMDVDHAAQAVKDFRPKIVYPYHYSGSDVNAFKAAVGDATDVRLLKWY
jgi:L-ascorbate metabolism protein UlaG (beta-lactamase superfamily)